MFSVFVIAIDALFFSELLKRVSNTEWIILVLVPVSGLLYAAFIFLGRRNVQRIIQDDKEQLLAIHCSNMFGKIMTYQIPFHQLGYWMDVSAGTRAGNTDLNIFKTTEKVATIRVEKAKLGRADQTKNLIATLRQYGKNMG